MEKDNTIIELIEKLFTELIDKLEICDYWDGDLCSIGIKSVNSDTKLIYVSTCGEQENKYYYECEVADNGYTNDSGNFSVVKKGDNTDYIELVNVIKEHFFIVNKFQNKIFKNEN